MALDARAMESTFEAIHLLRCLAFGYGELTDTTWRTLCLHLAVELGEARRKIRLPTIEALYCAAEDSIFEAAVCLRLLGKGEGPQLDAEWKERCLELHEELFDIWEFGEYWL